MKTKRTSLLHSWVLLKNMLAKKPFYNGRIENESKEKSCVSNKPPPPALPHCVPPGWALPFRAAPLPALQGPGWLLQSFRILRTFPSSLRMGAMFAGPQHPWFLFPSWPLLLLPEGSGRPPAAPGCSSPPAQPLPTTDFLRGAREVQGKALAFHLLHGADEVSAATAAFQER